VTSCVHACRDSRTRARSLRGKGCGFARPLAFWGGGCCTPLSVRARALLYRKGRRSDGSRDKESSGRRFRACRGGSLEWGGRERGRLLHTRAASQASRRRAPSSSPRLLRALIKIERRVCVSYSKKRGPAVSRSVSIYADGCHRRGGSIEKKPNSVCFRLRCCFCVCCCVGRRPDKPTTWTAQKNTRETETKKKGSRSRHPPHRPYW
jgi:hypothetical protein